MLLIFVLFFNFYNVAFFRILSCCRIKDCCNDTQKINTWSAALFCDLDLNSN